NGTNRRYKEYDALYVLTGDGFVDHYQFSAEFERASSNGLSYRLAYAYGKTEDNLVGQLSADPADKLNPFPLRLDGKGWSEGRCALDVPHRGVAELMWKGTGALSLTGRFRYQSGLPFTPGAPRGVDLNGDGSGGNDPVALTEPITGLTDLASRESCLSA